ncbi:MAG TPA: acyltransferase, partial [Pseudomonadales bacterium]|nr:acyltransferase [Pseudomonadales bacterium]
YSLLNTLSITENLKSIFSSESADARDNLAALNGMRALCVCWVVLHHYLLTIQSYFKDASVFRKLVDATPMWLAPVWHGELAVEVFFVLSGFLIGGTLMREHKKRGQINIKRFYLSRFLRLMPSYLLALLLFSPFLPNADYMWANLIYLSNYLPHNKMYMPWSWTLVLQEQFYFILPFFLLFVLYPVKNKAALFIGLLILSSVVRYMMQVLHPGVLSDHPANFMFFSYPGFNPDYFNHFYTGLHVRFAPLVLGLLGAYLHTYHKQQLSDFFSKSAGGYLLVSIAIAYAVFNLSIHYYDIRNTYSPTYLTFINVFSYNLFAVAVLIVLLGVIYPNKLIAPIQRLLSFKLWFPIAQLSFVMYLFHMLFVAIACQWLMNYATAHAAEWQNGLLPLAWVMKFSLLAFAGTILFSLIFSLIIERPFMNFRKFAWFGKIGNRLEAGSKQAVLAGKSS